MITMQDPAGRILKDDEVSGAFHFSFDGSAFILSPLRITSWPTFLLACLVTAAICLCERYLTYLLSTKQTPFRCKSTLAVSLWRSGLYWVATFQRLTYMLIAMSFHAGLIITIVTSLSIGQFLIEIKEANGCTNSREPYHPLRTSADIDTESYANPHSQFTSAPRKTRSSIPTRTSDPLDSELSPLCCKSPPVTVSLEAPRTRDERHEGEGDWV